MSDHKMIELLQNRIAASDRMIVQLLGLLEGIFKTLEESGISEFAKLPHVIEARTKFADLRKYLEVK